MNICTMNEGFQMPPLIVHVEKLSNKLLVEGIFQGRIALRNCNGGVTFYLNYRISTHSRQKASSLISSCNTRLKLFNSFSSASFCSGFFPICPTLKYMSIALSIPVRIVGISYISKVSWSLFLSKWMGYLLCFVSMVVS